MSFFTAPVNPDAERLLREFDAHLVELNTLATLIPLDGASSVVDMETWCADWDEFLTNFGACQAKATEKHIALPLTAAIGAKGDQCVAVYPRVQAAIVADRKVAAEYEKKMEEERWIAEEEEERARKAEEETLARKTAEAEELARTTAEAEELARKTAEAEELTRKTAKAIALARKIFETAQENERAGEDGGEEGSSEEEEKTGDTIVVKQKTGRIAREASFVVTVARVGVASSAGRHMFGASSAPPLRGKKAKAAAAAEASAPIAGPSRPSGRRATSDRATIVSEDEGTAPRGRPGPKKGKRKASEVEEDEELDLNEIDDQLEREFAIWGAKYQQAEGIMKEMKLEMDRVGALMAKRRRIRK
ncbi:hypothetical protein EV424DRAFT_1351669 [Suillus variegatus]|nr:hypothetical protein EV424DRAFT_1351669 [Suillus variegatus]